MNLAARLSGEARRCEILLDQRAWAAVKDDVTTEPIGEFELKGFTAPVAVFRVTDSERLEDGTTKV